MVLWFNRGAIMRVHIICEGPTDQRILEKIIQIISKQKIYFLEPSNTQRKNRGVNSILNPKTLNRFLRYSFNERADCIIVCVDNDDAPITSEGIPERYNSVHKIFADFAERNAASYDLYPAACIVVPIKTIDYWMLAGLMNDSGVGTIRGIETYDKASIKDKVYGKENLNPIGSPFESIFEEKLQSAINEHTVYNILPNLSSYSRFFESITKICCDER